MLAAHMFCFYFGIVADITPPVAPAAYAGSAIAKSNPFKTGINATKLAIAAFLIPYMFALNPSMIMIVGGEVVVNANTLPNALPMVVTALVGLVGIGAGFFGYLNGHLNPLLRVVAAAGGLLLVIPGAATDIAGIALIAIIWLLTHLANKKTAATK